MSDIETDGWFTEEQLAAMEEAGQVLSEQGLQFVLAIYNEKCDQSYRLLKGTGPIDPPSAIAGAYMVLKKPEEYIPLIAEHIRQRESLEQMRPEDMAQA